MSKPLSIEFVATALSPISHHDAAKSRASGTNETSFNRERRDVPRAHVPLADADRALVAARLPVPKGQAEAWSSFGLSAGDLAAAATARLFVSWYGGGKGHGLFSGMSRYAYLESRLATAGLRSRALREAWDRLVLSLGVPLHPREGDADLFDLWSLPAAVQRAACDAMARHATSLVAVAREWSRLQKGTRAYTYLMPVDDPEEIAEATGGAGLPSGGGLFDEPRVPTRLAEGYVLEGDRLFRQERVEAVSPESLAPMRLGEEASGPIPMLVPKIAANAARHQLVREPAMLHLFRALGMAGGLPGDGEMPLAVEALFYNGGNVRSGAKQPSGAFAIVADLRRRYPSLDLLGGCLDADTLGRSRLDVGTVLVCEENRAALAGTAAEPSEPLPSAYDLLGEATETRQALGPDRSSSPEDATLSTRKSLGQMIRSFETLAAGTRALVRLRLDGWAPEPTRGALCAALDEWAACPRIGGQAARGFGSLSVEGRPWAALDPAKSAYEAHIEAHREEMRAGLIDGTLGTGHRVLS